MSSKKYEVDIFDVERIERLAQSFENIEKALDSEELMKYLSQQCMKELNRIIDQSSITEEYSPKDDQYRSSNKCDVSKEEVRIYNDSMVDISHVSPQTATKYANGLSLAKLIEFGTGIMRGKQFCV